MKDNFTLQMSIKLCISNKFGSKKCVKNRFVIIVFEIVPIDCVNKGDVMLTPDPIPNFLNLE